MSKKYDISIELGKNKGNYIDILKYVATEGDNIIGYITLGKQLKNMFIDTKGFGEIEILELSGEIKAITFLFKHIFKIVDNSGGLLFIRDIKDKHLGVTNELLEDLGFVFQPVIYHQVGFIYGKNFKYNLRNIEKECHEFLEI